MIRVAFLRRDESGSLMLDGKQLEEAFDAGRQLPRIGEHVLIPAAWQDLLREYFPGLPPQRLEVVGIDHHWAMQQCSATVYLSTIGLPKGET